MILKNSTFNLLGYLLPVVFAIIIIPMLLKILGVERFGILNIVWMIIGYFSLFDFGIGKGLTKVISEKIGNNNFDSIPKIFWSSIILMAGIGIVLPLLILPFINNIVDVLNISPGYKKESRQIFILLLFSIPFITTSVGFRGFLEANYKFKIVSYIRSLLGILSFLLPLLVLVLIDSLFYVVLLLVILRIIIWYIYFKNCIKINKNLISITFDYQVIKPILTFSVWITFANIIGPIILYSDKFFIGILISASAIAYYVTPYEVVSKILLLPTAISGVLFPVFSSNIKINPLYTKKLMILSLKFIFILVFPIVLLLVLFSKEFLQIWLGFDFATKSYLILQCFAVGILMNCLSSIPNNFFQGIGNPKLPTLINFFELPFYLLFMWLAIKAWGINGAAFVYMIAAIFDAIIMNIFAFRNLQTIINKKKILIGFSFFVTILILSFILNGVLVKMIYSFIVIISSIIILWLFIITQEEKKLILNKIKPIINPIKSNA